MTKGTLEALRDVYGHKVDRLGRRLFGDNWQAELDSENMTALIKGLTEGEDAAHRFLEETQ